jgi:hypothetical protein
LPDQCYERGVLGRMAERVAHPDALKNQFRRLSDDLGVARLTAAEGARVISASRSPSTLARISEALSKRASQRQPHHERSLASYLVTSCRAA